MGRLFFHLKGWCMTDEQRKRVEERAAEFGLSADEYLDIAEENFYQSQPWLECKLCGAKVLIDEEQKSPHHDMDRCPKCGADDEVAFMPL